MSIEIREARAEDSEAIAALHVLSWQETYRGILPDSYLDDLAPDERREVWRRFFSNPSDGAKAFLAFNTKGELQGFIALDQSHEPGYDAYLENLHVSPGARGRGLGKRLIAHGVRYLIDSGASSLYLWVYDDNEAAFAFYKSLGGVADAHGRDPFAGADALHSRIGWRDLGALYKRCT